MRAPGLARSAAAVLAVEGAALVLIAAIEVVGLSTGDVTSVTSGVALIVLTLIGAGALFGFAVGTLRGRSWARSGGVVLQVLGVVLAIAALTIQPIVWPFVLGVGVPGLLGLLLLIASTRREAAVDDTTRG